MPIVVKDLGFSYFDRAVLEGLDAAFDEGLVHLLLGTTGSGKTTLALIMTGLVKPTRGSVRVDDCDPASGRFERTKLQLAFQFPEVQIFESTVEKEIEYGLKNFDLPPDEVVARREWAMECVGLSTAFLARDPANLSFGERRKTALASVIALKPKYLILDEPLAGLDWQGRRHLVDTIARLRSEGLTTLILTHETDLVTEVGDTVSVLDRGRVIGPMSPEEFLNPGEADPCVTASGTDSSSWRSLLPDFALAAHKMGPGTGLISAFPRRVDAAVDLLAKAIRSRKA